MRSALVFGGSGQIGVPVIERLLANDWRVTAVSRASQTDRSGLSWLHGDLQRLPELPGQVDAVFSLGPLDHFSQWYAQTALAAPRVIAFGSTSLETKRASEDEPERDVAARLRDAEARIFEIALQRRAGATVLRPTLVYGAGRDKTLSRIATLARRAGFFVLPANADGLRQPVHVHDLADAALSVVDAGNAHGRSYALPGGETLAYAEMVRRSLASLQPPARLIRVPTPLFKTALAAAQALGKMRSLGDAAVARMHEDLVFDAGPARRDFGYSPRAFQPEASMFAL
ncbi:MAG: NAD-dependent epimerase/dehydratase family protein [Pseudoxanthomonas sp.]